MGRRADEEVGRVVHGRTATALALAGVLVLSLGVLARRSTTAVPQLATDARWSAGVESWVTDLTTDQRLSRRSSLTWQTGAGAEGQRIVVDPTRRYQTMVGFGASMTDSSAHLLTRLPNRARRDTMRSLFSPTDGIGLSMLRQPMGASDFAVRGAYTYDDQPTGQTDADLSEFSIRHDRAAILPRLR